MRFEKDDKKYIRNLCIASDDNDFIKWDGNGLTYYLVVFGHKREDGDINNPNFAREISMREQDLIRDGKISIDSLGVECQIYSFDDMIKNGGFRGNGLPGIYIIYGIDFEECSDGTKRAVIFNFDNNDLIFTVDLVYNTEDEVITKGKLFKKITHNFKRVEFENGVKAIKNYCIFYTVGINSMEYPVPLDIVQNGGIFYVKCESSETIQIVVRNIEGITILCNNSKL